MIDKETERSIKEYCERRNKALNGTFEDFKKWVQTEPYIGTELPKDDFVLETSMHKMRLEVDVVYPKKKKESRQWLKERGLHTMNGEVIK